ncbi:ABC transporter permease [Actinoalloteichus spitiensis]|uniref:ABC transporter permease n=1 Tax=Actinoalloteichus spitiensis TaxID=252394 RepID=UPI00036CBC38
MTDVLSPESRFAPGTFTPSPGRGRVTRMLFTQARTELLLNLRHAEQLLLTMIIPMALLVGLSTLPLLPVDEPRVDSVAPRVFALAVISTAFTGQAIMLGFDRRYGVLKRLAATALPRWSMVGARVLANLAIVAVQLLLLGVVAAFLGWTPSLAGVAGGVCLLLLGVAAFGALGVLVGGALRAEAVLAIANTVWFVLLLAGGVVLPADSLPDGLAVVVRLLPSSALAEGMESVLREGVFPGWAPLVVLLGWAAVAGVSAVRTTRLT